MVSMILINKAVFILELTDELKAVTGTGELDLNLSVI
jgi:hypothetical protein